VKPEIAQHRKAVGQLCRRYHVQRLDLFGSAATGQDRPGESDLDFLVEFEPVPPGAYADTFFGLLEDLVKLFGRPVDLVVASAIKNPYFRQSVDRTRVLLYAAGSQEVPARHRRGGHADRAVHQWQGMLLGPRGSAVVQ
jgi:predicted nucleotidyltransferase